MQDKNGHLNVGELPEYFSQFSHFMSWELCIIVALLTLTLAFSLKYIFFFPLLGVQEEIEDQSNL